VANTVTITVDADTKKAESNVKGMGGKMQKAMKGVAMAGGALTLAGAAAAKLGQEYQEATNTIAAGTGATGEQLEGLTESFKNVWKDVPQDAATVSGVIADLNTELGLEGGQLEDVTKAFLDVSRAMGEDAQPMIKAVADSMVAFGVPAEEARSQLDKLTTVSQAVGVPMTKLADTVKKFGPQLQTMGLSLDESTALVGNMEAAGLSASKMMPGLNTAVQKLAKEGVTDISAGLGAMIAKIQHAESDTEAMAIATDTFGAGAGVRFKDAIDKGVFSLDDMLTAMGDSEGKVAELGKSTLTTSDKFDIMKNRVKESLTPIGNFANAMGPMVVMMPAIATGISAIGASQKIATAATWLQTAAMSALNLAMGPIGLIIIGIGAAIVAGIVIWKNWDKIVAKFQEVLEKTKPIFQSVKDFIFGALDGLKGKWEAIWNGMGDTVKTVWDGVKAYVNLWIGAINFLIRGMNSISFKMPDWVPGIGGKGFEIKIPEIDELPESDRRTEAEKKKAYWGSAAGKRAMALDQLQEYQMRGFKSGVTGLASGGIVSKPTLAMIGEKGPEAVVPLGRGGAGGITININGPTYGFDDFEQKVGEAIKDGVRRGGYQGILQTG